MQSGGWKMNASSSEEGGREGRERRETGTFIQATNLSPRTRHYALAKERRKAKFLLLWDVPSRGRRLTIKKYI